MKKTLKECMNLYLYRVLLLSLLLLPAAGSIKADSLQNKAGSKNLKSDKKSKTLSERLIAVDVKDVRGSLNTAFKACVGAGRAHEGLHGDWQRQLLEAKKECDFQRIRFHGLLHDEMSVYREDKDGIHLNFQYIDALFDYLTGIGVVPFIELGFMPEQLRSGEETIFWWRGNVTPPSDYGKWGFLIEGLAKHLKERYGEDEVATWYFEVWNEPNLSGFFSGTQEDYFKLYETSAKAIKRASERFRVGGPATAGCAWIPEFIDFCRSRQIPVDFITTHHYGVEGFLDEFGQQQLRMPENINSVSDLVNSTCDNVKTLEGYKDLEVHFTEWSSSYSPRDPFHDVYQNAPYVLNTLKRVEGNPASMSYWTFTDIFEEPGPVPSPFHGGFGLMTFEGIKKPTYFAYKFLNELGETELNNDDVHSWVCRNKKGDVQALFWNIVRADQGKESNQVYFKKDLPAREAEKVTVQLSNLKPGKYLREVYRTGYKLNDCYTAYYEMGSPAVLTPAQTKALKALANGDAAGRDVVEVEADGKYQEDFVVRENDVFFVKLKTLD